MKRLPIFAKAICCLLAADFASGLAPVLSQSQSNQMPKQTINTESGGIFMEEVQTNRPDQQGSKRAAKVEMKHNVDLSDMGVPVTPTGRIVPIIQRETGPVLEYSNRVEAYRDPGLTAVPWWSPYAGLPGTVPYSPRVGLPNLGTGYYPGMGNLYPFQQWPSGQSGGYPYPMSMYNAPNPVNPYAIYNPYLGVPYRPYMWGYTPVVSGPGSVNFNVSSSGFSIGGGRRWLAPYSYSPYSFGGGSILAPLLW